MIYLLSVMSTKHFGLKLIQDQKRKTFFAAVLTDTQTLTSKSLLSTWINTLQKLEKSNKAIFVMGDFNINLLSYDGHTDTNDFTNSMVSHYILPYILHPTRVTDHSSTVIDNIFSNVTDFDTVSGNIINQIADHFAQF